MALTPEGRVKEAVKKLLKEYAPDVYYHMPVQNGMGAPSLDFICCAYGRYVGIETKAKGKKPTPRQEHTMRQITNAGGHCFVIDAVDCEEMGILRGALEHWRTSSAGVGT